MYCNTNDNNDAPKKEKDQQLKINKEIKIHQKDEK